ncbi:hypothetical protein ACIODT_39210 [Streptomyces sp. NPDC088251]|uniref:hypothetical protein n=1 Tax=unclassified Streptomyces TaxID=2593676 RepID=UPI00382A2F0B
MGAADRYQIRSARGSTATTPLSWAAKISTFSFVLLGEFALPVVRVLPELTAALAGDEVLVVLPVQVAPVGEERAVPVDAGVRGEGCVDAALAGAAVELQAVGAVDGEQAGLAVAVEVARLVRDTVAVHVEFAHLYSVTSVSAVLKRNLPGVRAGAPMAPVVASA